MAGSETKWISAQLAYKHVSSIIKIADWYLRVIKKSTLQTSGEPFCLTHELQYQNMSPAQKNCFQN